MYRHEIADASSCSAVTGWFFQCPSDARPEMGCADGLILLNRYPYANGHLLVALGDARPRLLDYEPTQRAALWSAS